MGFFRIPLCLSLLHVFHEGRVTFSLNLKASLSLDSSGLISQPDHDSESVVAQ